MKTELVIGVSVMCHLLPHPCLEDENDGTFVVFPELCRYQWGKPDGVFKVNVIQSKYPNS